MKVFEAANLLEEAGFPVCFHQEPSSKSAGFVRLADVTVALVFPAESMDAPLLVENDGDGKLKAHDPRPFRDWLSYLRVRFQADRN